MATCSARPFLAGRTTTARCSRSTVPVSLCSLSIRITRPRAAPLGKKPPPACPVPGQEPGYGALGGPWASGRVDALICTPYVRRLRKEAIMGDNADHQRAWRQRQKAKLAELERQVLTIRRRRPRRAKPTANNANE